MASMKNNGMNKCIYSSIAAIQIANWQRGDIGFCVDWKLPTSPFGSMLISVFIQFLWQFTSTLIIFGILILTTKIGKLISKNGKVFQEFGNWYPSETNLMNARKIFFLIWKMKNHSSVEGFLNSLTKWSLSLIYLNSFYFQI